MKKLLAIVISMAMVVAMMPVGVFADAHNDKDENCVAAITSSEGTINYYDSLQEAVNAAAENSTIKLINNVTVTDKTTTIEENKKLAIDLNGYILSGTNTSIKPQVLLIKGKLTVKDSIGSGKICSSYTGTGGRVVSVEGNGNLTIEAGVTITSEGMAKAGSSIYIGGSGTVIMNGGKVVATGLRGNYAVNIKNSNAAFEMNGGEITAVLAGNETYITAICGSYNSTITIKNGEISGPTAVSANNSNIEILGGEFDGDIYVKKNAIRGGTFSSDISNYIPSGMVADSTDGKYTVKAKSDAVAQIGTAYYASLNDAIAAVQTTDLSKGNTLPEATVITLLRDTNGGFDFGNSNGTKAQNVVLDLNNTTLTLGPAIGSDGTETNGIRTLAYSKLEIKNGTIKCSDIGAEVEGKTRFVKVGIANYSVTTLDNVVLKTGERVIWTIHNRGELNLNGKTVVENGINAVEDDNPTLIRTAIYNIPYDYFYNNVNAIVNVNSKDVAVGDIVMNADGSLSKDNTNSNAKSVLNISAGQYGKIKTNGTKNQTIGNITGGTFSSTPKPYVAAEYKVYKYSDSKYEVLAVDAEKPTGYIWETATDTTEYDFIGTRIYVPSTPATPVDNVTNNVADKNTTADLTPAVSDNKSTTTVDNATADKIVDKAVANKSTEVIVDAKGNNTVASSEVAIPEKTVKEISEKTDANLVIKTDNGKVDLDKTALAAVAEQAGTTGTVKLVVETVKTDENICHVDLKLITSNGAVKDFKGGNVKVTINLTKELAAKELVCVYIDDNGIYTIVEGVLNADGTYTFTTGHFSEYAVMAKADADKVIADQLNTLIKEVNLKVRTSKTSKKNIKAVVSGDVKAITDAGYTVKYKFYRSEKKSSKYKAAKVKDTNTYINTTGKKGTKYYYKAKALVYDGDKLVGQTVLTQCKYGVRTWSK